MLANISGKLKRNLIVYAILVILIATTIGKVMPAVVSRSTWLSREYACNIGENVEMYSLEDETQISQTFAAPCMNLKGFQLTFGTDGKAANEELEVSLIDMESDEVVESWQRNMALVGDNTPEEFYLNKAYQTVENHMFKIDVKVMNEREEDSGAIFGLTSNTYEAGQLSINGKQQIGDLTFSVYGYNSIQKSVWLFYVVTIALLGLIAAMIYLRMNGKVTMMLEELSRADWFFAFIAILLGCVIFNQAGDMNLTIHHAEDLISAIRHGKFFDFYTVVMEKALSGGYYGQQTILFGANYNILLYLILAICIFPLVLFRKVTGIEYNETFVLTYFNILLAIAVVASAYLLFCLVRKMGQEEKNAKITTYLYLSSMLLIFSTVGFSQLDIFYILFMLWALLFYVQQKYFRFSLIMSLAIMLKMFPLLIFVPLILLVEKRVLHIIKYMAVGLSSTIIFKLIFASDYGYSITQEKMSDYYDFMGRMFENGISVAWGSCALFVMIIVVLCIYAFDKKCAKEELWKYVINIPLITFGAFILLVKWHPQWLAVFPPFMAMAVGVNRKRRSLVYLDWGISICVCIVSGFCFPKAVDNYMINNGILNSLVRSSYSGVTIADILKNVDYSDVLVLTALMAMLGYFIFASVKDICRKKKINEEVENNIFHWTVWARPASVYVYCLGLMCLYFFA